MVMMFKSEQPLPEVLSLKKRLSELRKMVVDLEKKSDALIRATERAVDDIDHAVWLEARAPFAKLYPGLSIASKIYPSLLEGMVAYGVFKENGYAPEFINAWLEGATIDANTWSEAVTSVVGSVGGRYSILLRRRDSNVVECWFIPNKNGPYDREILFNTSAVPSLEAGFIAGVECAFAVHCPVKDDASSTPPPQNHPNQDPQSESQQSEPAATAPQPVPELD